MALNSRHKEHQNKILISKLLSVTDAAVAYFLGLAWADGSLQVFQWKKRQTYRFSINLKESDMLEIEPIIANLGEFIRNRIVFKNTTTIRHPQIHFRTSDDVFGRFLHEMDYHIKSAVSPDKILQHIPQNLTASFWHGYFDGDGCLSLCRKQYSLHLTFCGSNNQDWSALKGLMERLGVTYRMLNESYTTKTGKTHTCSKIDISKRSDVKIVMDYLMSDPTIGLARKRQKAAELDEWLAFTQAYNHGRGKSTGRAKPIVRSDGIEFKSVKEAASAIGCAIGSIYCVLNGKDSRIKGYSFAYAA